MSEREEVATGSRWLQWHRLSQSLPQGMRLIQVLQRELRPIGSGTQVEEWMLLELEWPNERPTA